MSTTQRNKSRSKSKDRSSNISTLEDEEKNRPNNERYYFKTPKKCLYSICIK